MNVKDAEDDGWEVEKASADAGVPPRAKEEQEEKVKLVHAKNEGFHMSEGPVCPTLAPLFRTGERGTSLGRFSNALDLCVRSWDSLGGGRE